MYAAFFFNIIGNWTGFWWWNQPLQLRQSVFSRFTLFTPFISPPSNPPDENLVGHIKASALGPIALDLRESDLLLVLWSLSQSSLKGRLQPNSNNPLLSTQVEQKGTECTPVDRSRIENVAWPQPNCISCPYHNICMSNSADYVFKVGFWQGRCVHEHLCKLDLYDFPKYKICICFYFQI